MKKVPLGELAKPKQWGALSKSEMSESGHPVYGANGVIGYHSGYTHENPTLLIGCRGTIGAIHISVPRAFVTSNAMALDNLDTSRVSLHYLAEFLAWRGLADVTSGSSQPQLTRQNLVGVEIPLPSLDDQNRVTAILQHAEALSNKHSQILAHLDALILAIFHDMFGQRSDPLVRLKSLVDSNDRMNYGVVQPGDDVENGVPLIRVSNLVEGRVDRSNLKCISPSIESQYRRSRIKGTEILVSSVGSIGNVSTVGPADVGSNLARAITRVPITDAVKRYYVASYLRTDVPQRYFTRELRTVAQPTLNVKQLAATEIPLPPVELQRAYVARAEQVAAERTAVLAAQDAGAELFASLQSRAFRGEL